MGHEILIRVSKSYSVYYWSIIASGCSHWTQLRNVNVIDIVYIWRFILYPLSLFPLVLLPLFPSNIIRNYKVNSSPLSKIFQLSFPKVKDLAPKLSMHSFIGKWFWRSRIYLGRYISIYAQIIKIYQQFVTD